MLSIRAPRTFGGSALEPLPLPPPTVAERVDASSDMAGGICGAIGGGGGGGGGGGAGGGGPAAVIVDACLGRTWQMQDSMRVASKRTK